MQIEIIIIAIIIFIILSYTGRLNLNKLFADNEILFNNKKPDLAVRDLMLRDKKIESDSRNDWK